MKSLLLLRHGKSSWTESGLADHDRPLKKRGVEASKRMGRWLFDNTLVPDCVLTSSAVRAVATAQLASEAMQYNGTTDVTSALYHAEPEALTAVTAQVAENFDRVLIVGHNPGLESWLARLIGRHEVFPTAALALIELPIESWQSLTLDTRGTLQGLWRPKEFP